MKVTQATLVSGKLGRLTIAAQCSVPLPKNQLAERGRDAVQELMPLLADKLGGNPEARLDDQGLWRVYANDEKGKIVRLDLTSDLIGARLHSFDGGAAVKDFASRYLVVALQKLQVSRLRVATMKFENVWTLPAGTTNHRIAGEGLWNGWAQTPFAQMGLDERSIARVDVSFSVEAQDGAHEAFYAVELPANLENRTVWTSVLVRSPEEGMIEASEAALEGFVRAAFEVYEGPYAAYAARLLRPHEVDYYEDLR